jgi:DNA-binding NtrC family response regulator
MHRRAPRFPQTTGIFIVSDDRNYADMQHIFDAMDWKLFRADTWQSALLLPVARRATHFLYEHGSRDRNWIEALDAINSLPSAPAFIVTSRLGDERLWAEILNRGGYDLLLEPFDSVEVMRVVSAARKRSIHKQLTMSGMAG